MQFREVTLDNGLEVVAECNDRAYATGMAFFVKTGSRDESSENSGVSHFLEHMVFKGTPRRTADDVNRELDEIGSHSNAFTSEERTVYYTTILPEYQDRAIDLLSDILRPSLREDDFNTEKQVIVEEIYKYDDMPPFGAHEKCMAAFFGSHPLGQNVLGSVESVTALTPEKMRAYFDERYSPSNITLVASGDVDFDRLVEATDRWCGNWTNFKTDRNERPASPQQGFLVFKNEQAFQQYVVQITQGPSNTDPDRYAARLLATIIGDDSGSRFYWDLVETGRAEYAAMGTHEFQGAGIFMTYLCCDPQLADSNLDATQMILADVESKGITAAELEQAQNKMCAQIVLASERSGNRLFTVGSSWTQRREYRPVKEVLAAYRDVTLDDIHAVLTKYPLTNNTTVAVGPLNKLCGVNCSS